MLTYIAALQLPQKGSQRYDHVVRIQILVILQRISKEILKIGEAVLTATLQQLEYILNDVHFLLYVLLALNYLELLR